MRGLKTKSYPVSNANFAKFVYDEAKRAAASRDMIPFECLCYWLYGLKIVIIDYFGDTNMQYSSKFCHFVQRMTHHSFLPILIPERPLAFLGVPWSYDLNGLS